MIFFKFIFIYSLFGVTLFATSMSQLKLTTEEIKYIKDKKIIKMCNNQNWEPIEFAMHNDQTQMSGIVIDALSILSKNLNVEFKNIPTKDWSESQQFLKERKCDIVPAAAITDSRLKYANFTKPYLDYKIAIITKTTTHIINELSELDGKKMTRKKGSSLVEMMIKKNKTVKILETSDYLQSLTLVQDDKADFTIAPVPEASYYMSKFGLFNLHIAGYLDDHMKLSIAVRNDDLILLGILDKGLESIKQSELKQIHDDWTNIKFKESFFEGKLFKAVIFVSFVLILLFFYKHFLTSRANKNLQKIVDEKTQELLALNKVLLEYGLKLKDLNENLENRIIIEVDKTKKMEKQLFQSEKMAAMGEMIGNIAHQWRQPLSLISTSATGILIKKEYGMLDDGYLNERLEDINNAAQFLSKTIDDFRDLVKGDLVLEHFCLMESIEKALLIAEPILRNNDVKLIKNLDDTIKITSFQNPIVQSLMNILNNAKDVLVDKQNGARLLFLTSKMDGNEAIVSIKDNGGGIISDVMQHIFEPYFTTKHKTQGTGLGLHMTYNMITNELQGDLEVKNCTFEYNKVVYNGVEFIIKLPFLIEKQIKINQLDSKKG